MQPRKAYSYIRFSSKEQQNGGSEKRQLDATERYAARKTLELDTSLKDLGQSAYRGKHRKQGALGRFLALAQ